MSLIWLFDPFLMSDYMWGELVGDEMVYTGGLQKGGSDLRHFWRELGLILEKDKADQRRKMNDHKVGWDIPGS